jgi:hypothetical protein
MAFRSNYLTGDFFYNEPFWDISKNEGLQIFVKMDLKCNTYGPEHKTERFRAIEVIVKLAKIVFFDQNSIMFVDTVC